MKPDFRAVAAVVALLPLAILHSPPAAATLKVDDVLGIETVEDAAISPDGDWVAWVRRAADPTLNRRTRDIYLSRANGGVTIRLTRDAADDRFPAFSPDGQFLAFRSARGEPKKEQVYVLDLRGGEPRRVTAMQNGIESFAWLDNDRIAFSAREDSTRRERTLTREKDDTIVVADQEHYAPVRLFAIGADGRDLRRLTDNDGVVLEFAVSPDGDRIVMSENVDINYEYDHDNPPRQYLVDVATGNRREFCDAPYVTPYGFQWEEGGNGFYCIRAEASDSTRDYVSVERLHYYDVSAGTLRRVGTRWESGLGRGFAVVRDGVVAALADGVRDRIAFVPLDGTPEFVDTDLPVRLLAAQRNGRRVAYLVSDASTPPAPMTALLGGDSFEDAARFTTINEKLEKKTMSATSIVRWEGALGDTVEGILYYPPAYADTVSYPLVAWIHGGPASVDPDFFTERWSNYPHLLASRGALILKVNYHGSGNYGLQWMESIKGRYYELEVPDILSGVDYLVDTGVADSTRLAIMGWSNGSILAIASCLEAPDRFRALCAGAGDVNWTSDYGNCTFGAAFDEAYFGGPPWELPDVYVDKSPLFRMGEVKTPTLIMFGTEDRAVPTEQGWQHFRALQRIGLAPVRFLLFPETKHGLEKLSHQRRKIREELAWLDRFLFDRPATPDRVVDETSPLAMALKQTSLSRVGHLLGVEADATLLPEMAELAGIPVSRLEITRAQFSAFDPNYTYAPGTDNQPVNDISLPLAQAYCLWLSERTGDRYRLPSVAEMDSLIAVARRDDRIGNTLERWVGYRPTPDEREDIDAVIAAIEETHPLIEPAGSFHGVGDPGVYDLVGNVAEWAVRSDGGGAIRGWSAVTMPDDTRPYARPPLSYLGFRVVRDAR